MRISDWSSDVCSSDLQTVACSIHNAASNICVARPAMQDESVKRSSSPVTRELRSSVYDADLSNERKTWMRARIRVKIPSADTSVTLKVIPDESGSEITVGTVNYDASNTNFRTVTLPILDGGDYLHANSLQYVLVFSNTAAGSSSTANPEVDAVEIDFTPATQRRRQWRGRGLADEAPRALGRAAQPPPAPGGIESELAEVRRKGRGKVSTPDTRPEIQCSLLSDNKKTTKEMTNIVSY